MFARKRRIAAGHDGCRQEAVPKVWTRRARPVACVAILAAGLSLGGCAGSTSFKVGSWGSGSWSSGSNGGPRPSPRVSTRGPLPKGGGIYKVGSPYKIDGVWYAPKADPAYNRVGTASWYGEAFHARRTANGEVFDMNALTAAHPTLPLPSYAYVTNMENGRTLLVRINDRGPFVDNRIIDLSKRSAQALGLFNQGTGLVRVRYAGPAPLNGSDKRERRFLADQSWSGGARYAAKRAPSRRPWRRAYMSGTWSPTKYRAAASKK